jgi:thioredoxin-related protein
MKKKLVIIAVLTISTIIATAQEKGIHFEKTGLYWGNILAKAKAEHKYIFVDCYATWCGPCKEMDKDIYPLAEVGDAYNSRFISVKLQMDKTATDNDSVKKWYSLAGNMESNYTINAFPTFLFFDPAGNPVHKVTGSKNAAGFIQLAADAKNPDKQYYSILKNFRPGKLDTADLKGLARSFAYSDTSLAYKLALDYLTRIPKSQLSSADNRTLMTEFQYQPEILEIALKHMQNLAKNEVVQMGNAGFIGTLRDHQKVKDFAANYISKLNKQEFGREQDMEFIVQFHIDPRVQEIAKKYIKQLAEKQLYSKPIINFVAVFTQTPADKKGFDLFYYHAAKVNAVMAENNYAHK